MSDSDISDLPETTAIFKSTKKSKDKGKRKSTSGPKNEGVDPTWAYKPPEGLVLVEDVLGDAEEWDWDNFNKNEDLELWLIRVPNGVKPKHLENVSIDLPKKPRSEKAGTLNRKHTQYDIWNVGEDADQPVGGEELKGLSCLLPRKKKGGELRIAPRPISRHLVVSAHPPQPKTPESSDEVELKNPPRFSYPKELLTHRYVAFGSVNDVVDSAKDDDGDGDATMDVDIPSASPSQPIEKPAKQKVDSKAAKKRKNAGEVELPSAKKQKKLKK